MSDFLPLRGLVYPRLIAGGEADYLVFRDVFYGLLIVTLILVAITLGWGASLLIRDRISREEKVSFVVWLAIVCFATWFIWHAA